MITEPVAYLSKYLDNSTNITRYKPENQRLLSSKPLYTAEQLHPRVKMTQAEFDEWKELYYHLVEFSFGVHNMLDEILDSIVEERGKYTKLAKRVYQGNDFMSVSKKQAELVNLFINYSPDKPEETIEIIPDMKWFVRSKEPEGEDEDEYYLFLSGSNLDDLDYFGFDYAMAFDTKEEAEEWKNPLTEVARLPVEDE